MTDITSHTPPPRSVRRRGAGEYRLYFAAIFLTALPFACISCVIDAALGRKGRPGTPVARARDEAGRITPWIFSA